MILKYSKIKDVYNPHQAYSNPAGIDVYVPNTFLPVTIKPNENLLIPSGLKLNIPEGYYVEIKNRSSIAAKLSLIVGACIVDNDYQGEVFIDIHNIGLSNKLISPGDKIAQMVLHKKYEFKIEQVDETELYNVITDRGDGALGSSN